MGVGPPCEYGVVRDIMKSVCGLVLMPCTFSDYFSFFARTEGASKMCGDDINFYLMILDTVC